MRVLDEAHKSVVFVGTKADDDFTPAGTGFLVSVAHEGSSFIFVATADHVLDGLWGDDVHVRINRTTGDAITQKLSKSARVTHPDKTNDIALLNLGLPPNADQFVLPLDRKIHEAALVNTMSPGLGDEVATFGLYTSHYGRVRNIPVVRIGHISVLPDEPVLTNQGEVPAAYLIEVRSIAGLSGSPVFLNVPRTRVDEQKMQMLRNPAMIPVGMMLGYHLVQTAQDQISVPAIGQTCMAEADEDYSLDERNTGFAVVVPFERFFEMAESDHFVTKMDQARNR